MYSRRTLNRQSGTFEYSLMSDKLNRCVCIRFLGDLMYVSSFDNEKLKLATYAVDAAVKASGQIGKGWHKIGDDDESVCLRMNLKGSTGGRLSGLLICALHDAVAAAGLEVFEKKIYAPMDREYYYR